MQPVDAQRTARKNCRQDDFRNSGWAMMDQGRKKFTCPMITKKAGALLSAFSLKRRLTAQAFAHFSTAAEISQINPCLPGGPFQVPPFFFLTPGKNENLNITANGGVTKVLNQPVEIE